MKHFASLFKHLTALWLETYLRRRSMRKSSSWMLSLLLCSALLLFSLPADASQRTGAEPAPAFEVVSVQRMLPQPVVPGQWHTSLETGCRYLPDRVLCQLSLLNLTMEAYGISKYFEIDAPLWMRDQDHIFKVQATMPSGTTKAVARAMLRQALTERFGLKVHDEQRNLRVYGLVPSKDGPKLQPAENAETAGLKTYQTPLGNMKAYSMSGPGQYSNFNVTLDDFATILNNRVGLDRPIVNMTGLAGRYAIELRWNATEHSGDNDPAILDAVRQQLGLQLEKITALHNVLVVDHVEPVATPN